MSAVTVSVGRDREIHLIQGLDLYNRIEQPATPSRRVLNLSSGSRLLFPSFGFYRHPGQNRGPSPSSLTWIPFSNGMTDAPRYLDAEEFILRAPKDRYDELTLRLKARISTIPERHINFTSGTQLAFFSQFLLRGLQDSFVDKFVHC